MTNADELWSQIRAKAAAWKVEADIVNEMEAEEAHDDFIADHREYARDHAEDALRDLVALMALLDAGGDPPTLTRS